MNLAYRFKGKGLAYEGLATLRKGKADWTGVVREVPASLDAPLRWRKPCRIFVNSQSDLFHHGFSNEYIAAVFGVMAACPQHTFQILTKRAERLPKWFGWLDGIAALHAVTEPSTPWWRVLECVNYAREHGVEFKNHGLRVAGAGWPLPNVHLGVSAENQETAGERIPHLLATPAAVRWVSAEPLLGPLDLSRYMWPLCWHWASPFNSPEEALAAGAYAEQKPQGLVSAHARFLDWVVVGGESGNGARPFDISWGESVVKQCRDAGVPVFVKQLGARPVQAREASDWSASFSCFANWVNKAQKFLGKGSKSVCIDARGRVLRIGADFMRARDEGAFPVAIHDALPLHNRKGGDPSEWPESLRVRQFPEARS